MNGSGITYEDVIAANIRNQKDKEIENLKQEIERLNNIINELEKYCNENINFPIGCGITSDYGYAFENVLDKLKELKEKNNDNNKDNR